MPQPEQNGRHTACTVWACYGVDRYGTPRLRDPVPMTVRWNRRRSSRTNPDNTTTQYDGDLVVDREVPDGSLLFCGGLSEYDPTDPEQVLYQSVGYNEIDDIRGRETYRTCKVQRYHGTPPPAANPTTSAVVAVWDDGDNLLWDDGEFVLWDG